MSSRNTDRITDKMKNMSSQNKACVAYLSAGPTRSEGEFSKF